MRTTLRRLALVLAALTPVAGVVVLAEAAPPGWGAGTGPTAPVAVTVPPSTATLVCPGPLRLITETETGDDVVYDPQFDPAPVGSQATVRGVTVAPAAGAAAGSGVLAAFDGRALADLGAAGPAGVLTHPGGDGPTALSVAPVGDVPAWAAASAATVTTAGDLRGLAAAPCRPPTADAYLVGGGTEVGQSSRLVLQNVGATPAVVTLTLWGPAGAVEIAGSPEYLVPAGSERIVLLEGVAAGHRRLVAHVSAEGGAVAAHLQDAQVRGLVPGGVDLVVPTAAPALTQTVPALALAAADVDDPAPSVLRLLAPGAGTTARITLLGEAGPIELPEVTLVGGEVLDVPLSGIEAGTWTAVVEADHPIVAGAAVTRTGSDGAVERAWVAAVPGGTEGLLAVPTGATATLGLGVLPGAPVEVTVEVIDAAGEVSETRTTVAGGTTVAVALAELGSGGEVAGVVLRAPDPRLVWGLTLTRPVAGGTLISALVPVRPAPRAPEIEVRF